MPDHKQIEADLLQFLQTRCRQPKTLTARTDLLDTGLLDSLLLVDLIFQIEERYGVRFKGNQVSPGNFRSVAAIGDLVMRHVPPATAASGAHRWPGSGRPEERS
jgi:acyl carrier protein